MGSASQSLPAAHHVGADHAVLGAQVGAPGCRSRALSAEAVHADQHAAVGGSPHSQYAMRCRPRASEALDEGEARLRGVGHDVARAIDNHAIVTTAERQRMLKGKTASSPARPAASAWAWRWRWPAGAHGDAQRLRRRRRRLARCAPHDRVAVHDGADMSKPAQIEAMVRRVSAKLGGWTSWSTTPASSTWPTSRNSRSSAGTPSSPST